MGSTTTNRHGVAAFDFATVSGCDQLVVGPTHARGGTLDLLMTDIPDLVDGCRSKLVNVASGVPQGSVLGPLLFLLYTSELFSILENNLIGYADDSTLMAVVPSPDVRVEVACRVPDP